jgi:hypothetical protein
VRLIQWNGWFLRFFFFSLYCTGVVTPDPDEAPPMAGFKKDQRMQRK